MGSNEEKDDIRVLVYVVTINNIQFVDEHGAANNNCYRIFSFL